ncbi:hypothetical protein [Leclercia sp. W17]|nr:hypothetical protein [Leclercia sp. W17]
MKKVIAVMLVVLLGGTTMAAWAYHGEYTHNGYIHDYVHGSHEGGHCH